VLEPAAEIAAEMLHPFTQTSLGRLLDQLNAPTDYVAVLGMPSREKTLLAEAVARAIGGTYLADPVADWHLAAGDDPSGHVFGGPVQFLDRAARKLAGLAERQGPIISDFYFDECLAYGRVGLDEAGYVNLRRHWAERRETVPPAKLLVVLDAWEAAAAAKNRALPEPVAPAERLRRELLTLSLRAGQGPVMYVGQDDFELQLQEITAGIAAMQ
jgi:hypothetical protein